MSACNLKASNPTLNSAMLEDISSDTLISISSSLTTVDTSPTDQEATAGCVRRSGRKRPPTPLEPERRIIIKPKKILDSSNLKQIHSYYLDRKVKRLPSTLETIYEEPKATPAESDIQYMGSRKLIRCLNFNSSPSLLKLKVKKRQMKTKKVFSHKKKFKKISVDHLMKTLSIIEGDNIENVLVGATQGSLGSSVSQDIPVAQI